jgi:hypothetical protein
MKTGRSQVRWAALVRPPKKTLLDRAIPGIAIGQRSDIVDDQPMRSSGNATTKSPYVGFSEVDEKRDFRFLVPPENDNDAGLLLTGISVGAEMVGYVLVYLRRICWLLTGDFTRASDVSIMHTSIHYFSTSCCGSICAVTPRPLTQEVPIPGLSKHVHDFHGEASGEAAFVPTRASASGHTL